MLNSISWLQYAIATTILLIGYYSVIISIYYRHKIAAILNGKNRSTSHLRSYSAQKNVLGEIQPDQNSASIVSEELRFASDQPDQLTEENH